MGSQLAPVPVPVEASLPERAVPKEQGVVAAVDLAAAMNCAAER